MYNTNVADYIVVSPIRKIYDSQSEKYTIWNGDQIIKCEDGTKWFVLRSKECERFCGYLYLREALQKMHCTNVVAAENRLCLNGRTVLYLSKYYADETLFFSYDTAQFRTLQEVGFKDYVGRNLSVKDGIMYVFDTEKLSFDPGLHHEIDSYKTFHDSIKSYLEQNNHLIELTQS
ncbi:MAG: hypothetical protein Q8K75_03725 [Chlamydiales bacterium]|nr:hypothetical protein [Chlamydiales bacterium]